MQGCSSGFPGACARALVAAMVLLLMQAGRVSICPACAPPTALAWRHLQGLEKQLQQVDLELEENAGRVAVMSDHLKNVQQEITYAQHRVRPPHPPLPRAHCTE